MSEYTLHLSETLLAQARQTAKHGHMTLEQLFVSAIEEKLAALEADSLIKRRAAQANPERFKRILAQVPHAGVIAGDEVD
jgi:hypothetical protein